MKSRSDSGRFREFLVSDAGFVLLILIILVLRVLLASNTPVLKDEAMYWEWSHHPAFMYPDRPPLIAWAIGIFDQLPIGNRSLALRLPALLCGWVLLIVLYALVRTILKDTAAARWAVAFAASLPVIAVSGIIITPEALTILLAVIATALVWLCDQRGSLPDHILLGAVFATMLLTDIDCLLMIAAWTVYVLTYRRDRARLVRGALTLLVAIAPLLVISAIEPEYSSMLVRQLGAHFVISWPFDPRKALEFSFEQTVSFLFLGPVLIALVWKRTGTLFPLSARMPVFLVLFIVLTVFAAAFFIETHPQDTLLAYPPFLLAMAFAVNWRPLARFTGFMKWAAAANVVLVSFGGAAALVAEPVILRHAPEVFGQSAVKARKALYGWPDIAAGMASTVSENPEFAARRLYACSHDDAVILTYHYTQSAVMDISVLNPDAASEDLSRLSYLGDPGSLDAGGLLICDTDNEIHKIILSTIPGLESLKELPAYEYGQLIKTYRLFKF